MKKEDKLKKLKKKLTKKFKPELVKTTFSKAGTVLSYGDLLTVVFEDNNEECKVISIKEGISEDEVTIYVELIISFLWISGMKNIK